MSNNMKKKSYIKLSEVIPLSTPWIIMIEPTNRCNFQCTFCPTGDSELLKKVNRPIGHMELNLFKKIINDMVEFDTKIKSLRLFKDGEPFINKDIIEMIKYAKEKNITEEIYIISNGSLINKNLAEKIVDSGLDKLRISIEHVNNEKYKEITKTYDKYDEIVNNIKYLFTYKQKNNPSMIIDIKIIDTLLDDNSKEKFLNDFQNISDIMTFESLMGWSNSDKKDFTLGSNSEYGINSKEQLRNVQVCPEPFKGLSVNFNGNVSICCVDWSHKTLVGDLKKESLKEIWNGDKLQKFRTIHLKKEKYKIEACKECHYLKGTNQLANLDETAEKLLKDYYEKYI
jgi:radical SAM protein with 4Fe4S-binding SPASM domain